MTMVFLFFMGYSGVYTILDGHKKDLDQQDKERAAIIEQLSKQEEDELRQFILEPKPSPTNAPSI